MNIICPCCQAVFPLDAALEDLANRQAYTELLALTPFPELLPAYMRLFAPAKKALSGKKKARLTAELVTLIKAARFEYKRMSYVAPLEYWRMGFEIIQTMRESNTLELPLQSHNLLLAVMAKQINKAASRQEQQKEDQLAGRTAIGYVERTTLNPQSEISNPHSDNPQSEIRTPKSRSPMPQSVKDILKPTKGDTPS